MEKISIMKDLITLSPMHALAQIKSLLWIILHPHIIMDRRKKVQKIRKITDEKLLNDIIYQKSIVFEYFIKGNKKYSKL